MITSRLQNRESKLGNHSVPKEVYIALGMLSNAEITSVLHELTRPFRRNRKNPLTTKSVASTV